MSLSLVVLAAGHSTRFGRPKQLEPVGPSAEVLMDYCIYDAVLAGFTRLVIVTQPALRPAMEQHAAKWRERIDVCVAEQVPLADTGALQGTTHAVLCAREYIDGPFAVMNADDYYGPEAFFKLARAISAPRRDAAPVACWLMGYRLAETLSRNGPVTRALCTVGHDDTLQSIVEAFDVVKDGHGVMGTVNGLRTPLAPQDVASTNLWGFDVAALDLMQQSFDAFSRVSLHGGAGELRLADAAASWLDGGQARITVLSTSGEWFGMTYEDDLPDVRSAIADLVQLQAYPSDLRTFDVCGDTPASAGPATDETSAVFRQ